MLTAYVKPEKGSGTHIILGMPGWDTFLIGIERTSWPEKETVTTVAEQVEGEPEKRYVVSDVGDIAMEIKMVPSLPGGARVKGEELEARRHRKHMARVHYRSQMVQAYAQHDPVRAQTIIDEIKGAVGEMQNVAEEKRYSAMRFLESLEEASQFIREARGE